MDALRNRCDRAEGMSSSEFKDQFAAVLDKFRTEAAAAVAKQKKKLEDEERAHQKWLEEQKLAEIKEFGTTDTQLKQEHDSKCLDYNYNDDNIYMHDCHGEPNQRFWIDRGTEEIRTAHDSKCL